MILSLSVQRIYIIMRCGIEMNIDALYFSKKKFGPCRMAPSEWTQSVTAVRDILVAVCSAPAVNATCHIPYRPPIQVSLFLFPLSVLYYKRTLWCGGGQLWPNVGMGSLGIHSHWDCNAMGDAAKTSPHVPSTCMQSAILSWTIIHIIPSCQIYVAIDNPSLILSFSWLSTGSYLWNYVCTADNISNA
jgi:hypothetical protein